MLKIDFDIQITSDQILSIVFVAIAIVLLLPSTDPVDNHDKDDYEDSTDSDQDSLTDIV